MGSILLGLYSIFLIYIGCVYIDWRHLGIYGITKLILLIILFLIQYIINFNVYKKFIDVIIDSVYNIVVKTLTLIYGLIMSALLIFMPIQWGINNLTIVLVVTLAYITITMGILHYGIKREKNLDA